MFITLHEKLPDSKLAEVDVNTDAIARIVPFETGSFILTIDGEKFEVTETRADIRKLIQKEDT